MEENTIQPSEELEGKISVKLKSGKSLDEFCERHFDHYDRHRFEAVAIRFYFGKEMTVTLYALDKPRQEGSNFDPGRLPVKKFKRDGIPFGDYAGFLREINFTLTAGNFPIDEMEVINK